MSNFRLNQHLNPIHEKKIPIQELPYFNCSKCNNVNDDNKTQLTAEIEILHEVKNELDRINNYMKQNNLSYIDNIMIRRVKKFRNNGKIMFILSGGAINNCKYCLEYGAHNITMEIYDGDCTTKQIFKTLEDMYKYHHQIWNKRIATM